MYTSVEAEFGHGSRENSLRGDCSVLEAPSWKRNTPVVVILCASVPSSITLLSIDIYPWGAGDCPAIASDLCPE